MRILHSADWHLDAPIQGRTPDQTRLLRQALLALPGKIAGLAKKEHCDMMLLSGDLFDGPYTPESLYAMQEALAQAQIPVCIAPGNHDHVGSQSPWQTEHWPENVYIFTSAAVESIAFPQLDCRVYGAAFQSPFSEPLLEGFRAECTERYALGVFHGDPIQLTAQKNTVTRAQVQESGLDYLALGHIHKGDFFRAGSTLCAWPGCPMGRGFDELGEKGVLIVTLESNCQTSFIPLDTPRFHWLQTTPDAIDTVLPAMGSQDFYRIDLIGESQPVDIHALTANLPHFPNLELRDQTVPPLELWANAGDDSLEGLYFSMLQNADADPEVVALAARISRQILLGQEVMLP